MESILPGLIVGPIAILLGVVTIIFRVQIRGLTVNGEKAALGKKAGEGAGKLQKPFWIAVAGVGAMVIGCLMVAGAVVRLVSA